MISDTIDWTKIKTEQDLIAVGSELLYDESEIRDPIDMRHLNPNLTEEEAEDAMFWKDFVNGIMVVTGEAGNGKGVFLHMLSYKMKYYFGKRAILDTRPRRVYGMYIPFSKEMLVDQLARMSAVEEGRGEMTNDGRWFAHMIDEHGKPYRAEVFLRNSVLGLDEYGNKYMPRKQSNLAVSIDLLKLYDIRRHLQCLTLGVGIDINDFNRKSLSKTAWEARCEFVSNAEELEEDPTALIFGVKIRPVSYDPTEDLLAKGQTIAKLRIDAKEPKHCLPIDLTTGEHYAWKDIYNTQNAQGFESAVGKQIARRRQ